MTYKINIEDQPPNYPKASHGSHGFSLGPSFAQVASYIIITAEIVVFFVCVHQVLQNYVILGLYVGFGVLMIVSALVCSCSNPTDMLVYHYKWSKYT